MRALVLGIVCAACVAEPGTTSHAVYGGAVDDGDPAVVAVWASTTEKLCSGAVIAPRIVLTAAHCIDNAPDVVLFGSGVAGFAGIRVIEAEAHPSYDASIHYDDYGLLLLEKEAPVEPLPIFRGSIVDTMLGKPVRLVGYGDSASGAGVKRQATVVLDAYDTRVLQFGSYQTGLGPGDSGGPQLMTIDGEEVVVGVARTILPDAGTSFGARVDRVAESWIDIWIQDRESPWQGAFGALCLADSECTSGVCLEDSLYCSQACTSSYDCPAGIPCRDILGEKVCAYVEAAPDPEACTASGRPGVCLDVSECTDGHMSVPGYCPGPVNIQCCVPTVAPRTTGTTISIPTLPVAAEPEAPPDELSGGCSVHARPRSGAGAIIVALALALAASRRRRPADGRGPSVTCSRNRACESRPRCPPWR